MADAMVEDGGGGSRGAHAQGQGAPHAPGPLCPCAQSSQVLPGWRRLAPQVGWHRWTMRASCPSSRSWQVTWLALAALALHGGSCVWAGSPNPVLAPKPRDGTSSLEHQRTARSNTQPPALPVLPKEGFRSPGRLAPNTSQQYVRTGQAGSGGPFQTSTRLAGSQRPPGIVGQGPVGPGMGVGSRSRGIHSNLTLSNQYSDRGGRTMVRNESSSLLPQRSGGGKHANGTWKSKGNAQTWVAGPIAQGKGSPVAGVQETTGPQEAVTVAVHANGTGRKQEGAAKQQGGNSGGAIQSLMAHGSAVTTRGQAATAQAGEMHSRTQVAKGQGGNQEGKPGMELNKGPQQAAGQQGVEGLDASKLRSAGASEPRAGSTHQKFLVAICYAGRLTNQLYCMRNYVILARLLGWTLLVPTYGISHVGRQLAYQFRWTNVIDWSHMASCLQASRHGADANMAPVVTFEEYLQASGKAKVAVDRYVCANSKVQFRRMVCVGGHSFRNFAAYLRVHQDVLAVPPLREVKAHPGFRMEMLTTEVIELLKNEAKGNATVITLGDLFEFADWFPSVPHREQPICKDLQEFEALAIRRRLMPNEDAASVCPYWTLPLLLPGNFDASSIASQGPRALPPCCRLIWQPHLLVRQLVVAVQKEFFDFRYVAVHLRRDDFYLAVKQYFKLAPRANANDPNFSPIADAAREIERQLGQYNISAVFLATNARRYEIELFKSLLQSDPQKKFKVYTLKDISESDWATKNPLYKEVKSIERLTGGASVVLAVVDKFLCVGATKFFGSKFSTFTYDVRLMRQETPLTGLFA